jgi:uncharacterized protein YkwD
MLAGAGTTAADARAGSCRTASEPPIAATHDQAAASVVCVLNQERARRRLPRLRESPRLERAADRYALDMGRQGFFSHTSPDGGSMADRLREVGYARAGRAWAVGETLAWGTGARATPAAEPGVRP